MKLRIGLVLNHKTLSSVKTLLLCLYIFLCACNIPEQNNVSNDKNDLVEVDKLVKHSQDTKKLGNFQELFVAPYKGGYAVVHASTPKGLDSSSLAFYWVQNKQQQAYAINELAMDLSPSLPRFNKLPLEINPGELLAVVRKSHL